MKKYFYYVVLAVLAASCTCAIYYQNHTQGSTQKVENPTELSADSSSIHFQIPLE